MGIVLSSVFSACLGFYKVLMKDTTLLALTTKGVLFTTPSEKVAIAWRELHSVKEQKQKLIFDTSAGEISIPSRFLGISRTQLCRLITETHKKILLGVIS